MNQCILLAKSAVENYLKEGKIIEPPKDLPQQFLEKRAGVFVTLKKNEELRGCIGTYLPTKINIAEEIIRNAISSATEDGRFEKIQEEDLPHLSYTVYILSEPESVEDKKDLDPEKFGIIVKTAPFAYPDKNSFFDGRVPFKSGLLLPGLEEIKTPEEQFLVACQKAGINPAEEKVFLYRFSVEKHDE